MMKAKRECTSIWLRRALADGLNQTCNAAEAGGAGERTPVANGPAQSKSPPSPV